MTTDEQIIRNLVAKWRKATATGDVETALGFIVEKVVFLFAGQSPMGGRSVFEEGFRSLLSS